MSHETQTACVSPKDAPHWNRGLLTILFAILAFCGVLFLSAISSSTSASPLAVEPSDPVTVEAAKDTAGKLKKLPAKVTFNAHIRPIMSNTCFACHGPDDEDHHSDLRLDSFELAVDEGGAIEPGDAEESMIYQRMMDEDDPMPPADFRHQLSDYEKALFKKWIDSGAKYEEHWSYAPLKRPEVPTTSFDDSHVTNAIDSFVLARLDFEGLRPSQTADKSTLLRRLSLDLIGLPPTIEELDSFLADDSDDAYQKQVERLLASPHFGERMAAQWLDIVRFSDTAGFHGDQNMRIFSYRDYVIDSLNNNKPFDVFTREQLAGDLLENPTPEQLTATGLIRLNMVTREGGAQPAEYLAKYTADRVRMLGTAWLGSTTGCCECHNHKYDPYSIKDFYSLGAFFDDIRQWGVYTSYGYTPNPDLKGFTNNHPFPPELRLKSDPLLAQIEHLESVADSLIASKTKPDVFESAAFRDWASAAAKSLGQHADGWVPVSIKQLASSQNTPLTQLGDGQFLATGKPQNGDQITVRATLPADLAADGLTVKAFRLEVLADEANNNRVGRSKEGRFAVSLQARAKDLNKGQTQGLLPLRPRYVRIELNNGQPLSLAEVEVFADRDGKQTNIALKGTAKQSTTAFGGPAKRAIDGKTDGIFHRSKSVTHTEVTGDHWWEVDLGSPQKLSKVVVWNRMDKSTSDRLKGYNLVLLNDQHEPVWETRPKTPNPSIEELVPDEAIPITNDETIPIEFAQADRFRPARYKSGRPSRFLEPVWQSGPIRWQLPADETKLTHTATYQLHEAVAFDADHEIEFVIKSKDIGRVRLSVSPLTRYVAGLPAANATLAKALQAFANDEPSLSEQHRNALLGSYYLATTRADKLPPDVQAVRDQIADCRSGMAMTLIAQQASPDKRHQSRVLPRGDWQDTSGEKLSPATPSFLPSLEVASERALTRLDLANWITSDQNPLTARHYVNRLWKHLFGAGLSNQLDDLGNQGEWPSHPFLLDWMASEFRETWDVKHMVRLIVNSNTYRQQASVRSDLSEIDPYNRLLSQQSARRLEAEVVRDNALAIAGLLFKDYVGGPSVFPYQPAGHYQNIQFPNRGYSASRDALQYRRGVYMHWQRTFLHPMLVNFDAPSRDECTADRVQSNSPQQALTLLNDPQFVETSNAMAIHLLSEHADADFETRLNVAFRKAVAREASSLEQESLRTFFDEQLAYYQEHPKDINELLFKNGQFKPSRDAAQAEAAAWAQVCRVVLNLHETITRF